MENVSINPILQPYLNVSNFFATNNNGEKYRCCIEYDDDNQPSNVFVFGKKMTRRGWRFTIESFLRNYMPIPLTTDEEIDKQWKRRLKKAVKLMDESGLWDNIKTIYKNLLDSGITYQEKCKIYDKWSSFNYKDEPGKQNFYKDIQKKYPFMVDMNNQNELYLNCDYIWELSECKLKSMYFGKGKNDFYKNKIQEAMQNKNDYSCRATVSYDVSFEYNTKLNKAWYSEEYRNCGNGHYYLALNNSTALFYEND